jgi:hypothetical protein
VTGAAGKNPQRYRDRSAGKGGGLGNSPAYLEEAAQIAWREFERDMPWLGASDRVVAEMAARLTGEMRTQPDFAINRFAQLRLCLSSMGATPADRSKVGGGEEEDDDPAAAFLN